ncbi:hypothetical protein JIG36_45580 [Actinoplanes sp. LDG1-06]|uniref:Uncharacterized protein n=1 Tax=Paractinoplanes ovalisporus TaxID=2810368 RepID=A0ABS2ASJ0_9ACTN|nr:hypothetical protein [Actinoplanes ovalisporus]MBM2622796.1 hypothetical protein [Actinoplanes ovalisporus]
MVTRRVLFGAAGAAGLVPFAAPARAATPWPAGAIATYPIAGARATVALHRDAAAVLLHIARRWHYEIAPLDTGEGGVTGWRADAPVEAGFESHYRSGTGIALYPRSYPLGGREKLWPHQELVVRDILLDVEGVATWGGDLTPAKAGHFHIAVPADDTTLAAVRARLDPLHQPESRRQTAGAVTDPATPARRDRARKLPRRRR